MRLLLKILYTSDNITGYDLMSSCLRMRYVLKNIEKCLKTFYSKQKDRFASTFKQADEE